MSLEDVKEALSIFGNRHAQAVVVVVVSLVLAKLVEWALVRVLTPLGRRTRIQVDDQIIERLRRPIFSTVLLAGTGFALAIAQAPPPFDFIGFGVIKTLVVSIWLIFGVQASALVLQWMAQHPTRYKVVQPVTLPLFEIATKLILIGGASYFILVSWNVDVTGWLVSGSIIGIAVGFAAKDTLSNLFAGVFILADSPYRPGDFIILDKGERGRVTRIGLRSTRIVTQDGVEITIPNSIIANSQIINESRPIVRQRIHVPVGVDYGSDADQIRQILLDAAKSNSQVVRDPEPRVHLKELGAASLNFELLCWIDDPKLRGQVIDALNTTIYKGLSEAGIDFPNTKHDVYIKELPKSRQDVFASPHSVDEGR
jgi:small-conductance mechanosensitive channel